MVKQKGKLEKIAANPLSRGMSLVGLTLQSGSSYASLKFKQLLPGRDSNKEADFRNFLEQQAEHFVAELGKLKGSIMKAGQMLSVYGEHFFSPEVNKILKALQSDSTPMEWNVIEGVLKKQWTAETFAKVTIDKNPIGAASLGQVFRARIAGVPEEVVIKVQYPGVDRSIDSDLKALRQLLAISHLIPKGPSFDEIYKEVRMMLHHEVNYLREMEILQEYSELLRDHPRFVVPKVYPEYCTKRVLVMSYAPGVAIDGPEVKALPQNERDQLALDFLELSFKEVFEWRTVQTDPHFGNYRVQLDNGKIKVALFDFGAVRKFSKSYIKLFAKLAYSAMMQDREENIKAGREMGFLRDSDKDNVLALFNEICFAAATPFTLNDGKAYDWTEGELLQRLTDLAKDAVFAFRFRSPPREAIFLDRKMMGMYMMIKNLGLKTEARSLLLRYLKPWVEEASGIPTEGDD